MLPLSGGYLLQLASQILLADTMNLMHNESNVDEFSLVHFGACHKCN